MQIGSLRQKASSTLVFFVLGCSCISTFLLWSMQKAVARAEGYYPESQYGEYIK